MVLRNKIIFKVWVPTS